MIFEKANRRTVLVSVFAVLLMLTMSVPAVSADPGDEDWKYGDGSQKSPLKCYMARDSVWETSLSFPASTTPSVKITVMETAITESNTMWSQSTTDGTVVSYNTPWRVFGYASVDSTDHKINIKFEVPETSYTYFNAAICATSESPSQKTFYFFHVNIVDPEFTSAYQDMTVVSGQTIPTQTPAVSMGNGISYSSLEYSIADSEGKTLTENTGLSFDSSTGVISGKVTKGNNLKTAYTVTAKMGTPSGYVPFVEAKTVVNITAFGNLELRNDNAYAITAKDSVSIGKPTDYSSDLNLTVKSISGTLDGESVDITVGTPFNGLIVASDGSISGVPTKCGVYVIKETFGSSVVDKQSTRTVTITVEDQASIIPTLKYYTYAGADVDSAICGETDKPKINDGVRGTWSVSGGNDCFKIDPATGIISLKEKLNAGVYEITVTFTSSSNAKNTSSIAVYVYCDDIVRLSKGDAGLNTIYAATSSESLVDEQQDATVNASGTLYSGFDYVYTLEFDGGEPRDGISIDAYGRIKIADTLPDDYIGDHKLTVRVTGGHTSANYAEVTFDLKVVAALVLKDPQAGPISTE